MTEARDLGNRGEDIACAYLQERGYDVVARQWRCQYGEIDLIMWDGDVMVFCEVKTRMGDDVQALGGIDIRKRERLVKSAQLYAHEHEVEVWRIDGVGILMEMNGTYRVNHVEDILDW